MKNILRILAALVLLAPCQTLHAKPPPKPDIATRNNCYSLLHQLCDEQKDVSLLHIIKHEYPDFKDLMQRIAKTSGTGAKLLEEFARKDASLHLDEIELPVGEVATRDAIADTKKKELLGTKGEEFHLNLLLSQLEALNYGSHLADVACENDTNTERERALADMSKDLRGLYKEAFEMLLTRTQLKTAGDK